MSEEIIITPEEPENNPDVTEQVVNVVVPPQSEPEPEHEEHHDEIAEAWHHRMEEHEERMKVMRAELDAVIEYLSEEEASEEVKPEPEVIEKQEVIENVPETKEEPKATPKKSWDWARNRREREKAK